MQKNYTTIISTFIINNNCVEISLNEDASFDLSSVKKHFGDKLFDTSIRVNVALAEAPVTGKDIFNYAPNSNGAIDYSNLVDEILMKV